jgi:hypothetical protein
MGHSDWSKQIPSNEAYKRAGGRSRINAQRQLRASYKASEAIASEGLQPVEKRIEHSFWGKH